ncbi:uncharacterized protein [Palaemon carinicauda]|uniref:uncharacterized protein n=1 Tax=Palaemon carinicauda TaxID=392227 RepID=UPI0035B5A5E2
MDPNQTCIINWNARSLISNLSEFKNMLYDRNPHIVGLCETWLTPRVSPVFQGYTFIRRDKGRGGGVGFFIRKDLKFSILDLGDFPEGSLEVMGVKVGFSFGWEDILMCYNSFKSGNCFTSQELDYYFDLLETPALVMGDFNAHHTYWDPHLTDRLVNRAGRVDFNSLLSHNLTLLLPLGLRTRIDPYRGDESTLDLCLGSGWFTSPSVISTEVSIGSDHLPVMIRFERLPIIQVYHRPRWSFKGGESKWHNYKQLVIHQDNSLYSIDEESDSITNEILVAGKNCFKLGPGKFGSKPRKPWWNDECSRAVAIKRRAYNKWKRCPIRQAQLEYRRLEAKAKKIIRKSKRLSFHSFCSQLNFASNTAVA